MGPLHHRHVVKTAERAWFATKLCALRTFHPARGGEAGVLPGAEVRPRQRGSASWTSVLVRRATPFAALAAVFAAQGGLALAGLDGRLLETNQPLALILGRSRDELLRTTLGEVIVENDRTSIDEGLALLRSGDVTRWDADTHVVRPDGSAVPAALFIARLPNPIAGDASLLVQLADISARSRAGALRDCVAAVRQIIVTSPGLEAAMPQLLRNFCGHLDWNVAQYWAADADRKTMHVRNAWNASGAALDAFLHASRGVAVTPGAGLVGRVWQSGVLAAEEDLESTPDHERVPALRSAALRSVVAVPVIDGGAGGGVRDLA